MKGAVLVAGIAVVGALGLLWSQSRGPGKAVDRGPSGIEFVIPAGYTVLDLGETTLEGAAARLARGMEEGKKTAVRFTRSGDRIQLLADPVEDTLEEQVMLRHGTVRRVVWPDSVLVRLRWAQTRGDFGAPGLPPPVARNPYH